MSLRSIALAAAVFTVASAAVGAGNGAVRKDIEGKYKTYCRALLHKDARNIMALSTPDFTVVQPGRPPHNRKQAAADLNSVMARTGKVSKAAVHVAGLKVTGNRAVATVHMTFAATMKDEHGKTHQVSEDSTSHDTWVKTRHGWLVQKVRIVSDKMTMDGKPMPAAPASRQPKKT